MKRRNFLQGASLAAGTLPAFARTTLAQKNAAKTLRIIHNGNLASLDPIWTTAPPTKDYAFLTFDQLLAVDSNYVPHPQMAEGWTAEDDGRAYVLGLREGLKFHDGEPVRSSDCIASIQRWGARDGFGQLMMKFVDSFETIDDRKFRIKLKKPFALLPAALGKSNSSQCFIMPERMAKVDPMKQVTGRVGEVRRLYPAQGAGRQHRRWPHPGGRSHRMVLHQRSVDRDGGPAGRRAGLLGRTDARSRPGAEE